MNSISIISENSEPNKLFSRSPLPASYLWKNLNIERKSKNDWVTELYKGSILESFWSIFTSPLN